MATAGSAIKDGDIVLSRDREHDVFTVSYRSVTIANAEDAERVRDLVDRLLRPLGRKIDLMIDLSGLTVKPAGMRPFGKVRAWLIREHTSASVRFGGNAQTMSSIHTSAVIDGVGGEVTVSRDDALREILAMRAAREAGTPSPVSKRRA